MKNRPRRICRGRFFIRKAVARPRRGEFRLRAHWLCLCCAGLPSSVRARSGPPGSPFEAGALPVLRPARRIHIRLRGRVLCNPPRLKGFRSAAAPTVTARGSLGSWANVARVRLSHRGKARLLPRAASTVRSAIRRRRNTGS